MTQAEIETELMRLYEHVFELQMRHENRKKHLRLYALMTSGLSLLLLVVGCALFLFFPGIAGIPFLLTGIALAFLAGAVTEPDLLNIPLTTR